MDDIFTRWPHAEPADIYQMFPPDGASAQQVAAGAAVICILDDFWNTSIRTRMIGFGSTSELSALGIKFKSTDSNAIYTDSRAIYRIPILVKQVLNSAFPNASEYIKPSAHRGDIGAPYHGPNLLDAVKHPLVAGILGFLDQKTFATLKWRTLSIGLQLVGAPAPSEEAKSRIVEALTKSRSEFGSEIEHIKSWMNSPPHNFLGELSGMWFDNGDSELAMAQTISRFIYTDEKIDGKVALDKHRMSIQTRLRFLLHFPDASGLFEPYAELGEELLGLRHAIDNHRGNMLDELEGLVSIHLKDHERFRNDPENFIETSRSKEEARIRLQHEEGLKDDELRDARETYAIMTLGSTEFKRRIDSGEDLPDLPDDMEP